MFDYTCFYLTHTLQVKTHVLLTHTAEVPLQSSGESRVHDKLFTDA